MDRGRTRSWGEDSGDSLFLNSCNCGTGKLWEILRLFRVVSVRRHGIIKRMSRVLGRARPIFFDVIAYLTLLLQTAGTIDLNYLTISVDNGKHLNYSSVHYRHLSKYPVST